MLIGVVVCQHVLLKRESLQWRFDFITFLHFISISLLYCINLKIRGHSLVCEEGNELRVLQVDMYTGKYLENEKADASPAD